MASPCRVCFGVGARSLRPSCTIGGLLVLILAGLKTGQPLSAEVSPSVIDANVRASFFRHYSGAILPRADANRAVIIAQVSTLRGPVGPRGI